MSRRSGFERRLRRELHGARPPRADAAERRAWHVVRAAHAARAPERAPHRLARLAVAVAAAILAAALALTPAGAKMGDWIDDVVSPAPEATRSSLSSLPAPGRLLVVADSGAWLVHDHDGRRPLGDFSDVTWSPGGRFVAGARGHELVAVDPLGHERWIRPASGRVSVPRWSPDGYRVAYRSGSDLRVAYGDNADDWLLAHATASTPPAWKPLAAPAAQVLAFAAGGRVRIVQVDTRDELGRTPLEPTPREIWWADGGRRLVTVGSRAVRIHGSRGRLLRTVELPAGSKAVGSAVPRGGRRLAVIASRGSTSSLLVLRLDRPTQPRSLFSARGEFDGVTWSVDGSLLVVGLPQADQWLYVRPRGAGAPQSVGRIRHLFEGGLEPRRGAFPRPAGWCFREPATLGTSGQPPCLSGSAP
jgi:dipeptidyl aminopeptidase/acylaminoacyl peptidase